MRGLLSLVTFASFVGTAFQLPASDTAGQGPGISVTRGEPISSSSFDGDNNQQSPGGNGDFAPQAPNNFQSPPPNPYPPQGQNNYPPRPPPPQSYPQQQGGSYPQQQGGSYPQQQGGSYPPPQGGSYPPPPPPSGSIPEQFRVLEKDTVALLQAIKDYTGQYPQAQRVQSVENKLQADFETAISVIQNSKYSFSDFVKAQPSIVLVLKNCNSIANNLLAKKELFKSYGASNYFLAATRTQYSQAQRMQAAINAKVPALVKLGSSAEFTLLYKTLDRVIKAW